MLLSESVVEKIRTLWVADQAHPYRRRDQRAVPAVDVFAKLLDCAFRTSLLREEGRALRTSIAWLSPSELDNLEIPRLRESRLTVEFTPPVPLSPATLAKIGSCVDGVTSMLLVTEIDGRLCIWGLLHCSSTLGPLFPSMAGTNETRHFAPDCLTVTVHDTGQLHITRSGTFVARLEQGESVAAEPTPLGANALTQSLWRMTGITLAADGRSFSSDADVRRWHLVRAMLDYIFRRFERLTSGGTLIIVPPQLHQQLGTFMSAPWPLTGGFEMARLADAALNFEAGFQQSMGGTAAFYEHSLQVIRQRLDTLIRLCGVDGAVLTTPSLDIIAFGAKLRCQVWTLAIEPGPGVFSVPRKLNFRELGTRHNSAKDFVGEVEGSVAFVASADGPVRAMTKTRPNEVMYWADCRNSMFV